MHGPQFLIDYDVIIVTVNYRLGPLGQLSLDTGLVSGNQVNKRLKDLILWEEVGRTHKTIRVKRLLTLPWTRGYGTRVWLCTGSRRTSGSWGETGPGSP